MGAGRDPRGQRLHGGAGQQKDISLQYSTVGRDLWIMKGKVLEAGASRARKSDVGSSEEQTRRTGRAIRPGQPDNAHYQSTRLEELGF